MDNSELYAKAAELADSTSAYELAKRIIKRDRYITELEQVVSLQADMIDRFTSGYDMTDRQYSRLYSMKDTISKCRRSEAEEKNNV